MNVTEQLSKEFNIRADYAANIVEMIDDGNTIPFIARYRKERTGSCNDQTLRELFDRLTYLRSLEERKGEVHKAITERGGMTDALAFKISNAITLTEVEDIYRPFKQKKRTRASIAAEKGLKPLADAILEQKTDDLTELVKPYINAERGVKSAKEALQGAQDIIAEAVSDNADVRKKLRSVVTQLSLCSVQAVKSDDPEKAKVYESYADFSESIAEIKSHRVLAINRGEKEGCLKVKLSFDHEFGKGLCADYYVKNGSSAATVVKNAVSDGYDRLIFPSIEREVRSVLTEKAEEDAIQIFEVNLRSLLMQAPLKGKVTMGFDPGYRTGCKVAVVDETGKVLDKTVVYPTTGEKRRIEEAKRILRQMILKHKVNVISVGNGTASKESEIFISELLQEIPADVSYTMTSEAGASVYSASALAAEEFPDYDVSERSAVSIARRLQDPLAELIKIDPKSIGVGQYQHDMDKKRLDGALSGVLEDCVNRVGVDLNTASVSLLKYVAGLNATTAKNIVAYREQNGKFTERKQLKKVPKLGDKAFEQCAGFLRITDGKNVLDNTAVHPESYQKAEKLLAICGYSAADVANRRVNDLAEKVKKLGEDKVAAECGLDRATLRDVIGELLKPGRDVRDSLPSPTLRKDILDISSLKVGMVLSGTVRNMTAFGAFVDIGVHQDGLVHISEISDRFITKPSDVLSIGQAVEVRVISVDVPKKRIGLSMKIKKS